MASHKLLFYFFFFTSVSIVSSLKYGSVNLDVYYEALCPFCADFIVNVLRPELLKDNLMSIVNLRLIPWGNAVLNSDGSVTCQHGPSECWFDNLDACVLYTYPDSKQSFLIIECMEQLGLNDKLNNWATCFTSHGFSSDTTIACLRSQKAGKLEDLYAEETMNLSPQHKFVPWVVVNDIALREDFPNFVSHICKAYKGYGRPVACYVSRAFSMKKTFPVSSVCYRDETKNMTSKTP